jgi:hypothetical protein
MMEIYYIKPEDRRKACEGCSSEEPLQIKTKGGGIVGTWNIVTRFWPVSQTAVMAGTFHSPCADDYIAKNRI